jgi:hypothetical protein
VFHTNTWEYELLWWAARKLELQQIQSRLSIDSVNLLDLSIRQLELGVAISEVHWIGSWEFRIFRMHCLLGFYD